MPTIPMFQGILIKMFRGLAEHDPPHIHAWYQGQDAWIELRREELLADWELARLGLELEKIAPIQ